MNIWEQLPKPFFVLAPMDDVTDTVFRRVIATLPYPSDLDGVQGAGEQAGAVRGYGPDVYFTEFVNVDALQSKGREATMPRLAFTESERPIIAQVWGLDPENFRKSARDIAEMGFDGIDLNFGCPDKNVVRNGACSAFIKRDNWSRAIEIIEATKEGLCEAARAARGVRGAGREGAPALPLSVKTRLGFNEVDMGWFELLLNQTLNALTIHGRTRKQMSKVPADWEKIGEIAALRTSLSPSTKIIGNGDVLTRSQGVELAQKYGLDGIMVGRGIFHDPYLFAEDSPWSSITKEQKIQLYRRHVELFAQTWSNGERKVHILNKFCKIYINGFDGAKELRERLMAAKSTDELLELLAYAGQEE